MRASFFHAVSLGSLGLVAAATAAGCERDREVVIPDGDDVVVAEVAPPPISGGTLLVTADAARAVAADSDRDVVWIVDIAKGALERTVALQPGDEPGRVVEDAAGRVHVALRSAGAIASIDPFTGSILRRSQVCAAPRGLAFDGATGHLHVACAGGELVTVDAATGAEVRRLQLDKDLRDVVVKGDRLLVTRFRSAEVLSIDAEGNLLGRAAPPGALITELTGEEFDGAGGAAGVDVPFAPVVAWRTIASPDGGLYMVHQRAKDAEIELETPGGYGHDDCGSIVHSAVTEMGVNDDGTLAPPLEALSRFSAVLPVDIAVSPSDMIAVVGAGNDNVLFSYAPDLQISARDFCTFGGTWVEGTPVAVAFAGQDAVVQTREPAKLQIITQLASGGVYGATITLPGESVRDTGHDLFHFPPSRFPSNSGFEGDMEPGFGAGSLACASCHPEGGDDSHVWTFGGVGPRRTQAMRGGILSTLPLHWEGDMDDVGAIMDEVFVRRMGGSNPGPARARAIAHWIDDLPAPPAMRDPSDAAAVRGKEIFESATVGCAQCHSGPMLTNNQNAAVGRGEALQVPSLIGVAWRAPFMHDGCAATLMDRFDPACGGAQHGDVSGLSEADLQDLVAYLESL